SKFELEREVLSIRFLHQRIPPSNPPPVVEQDHWACPATDLLSSRDGTDTILEQRYRRDPLILGK
ncbi:hypothetical protein QM590_13790, partial [Rhodococcus sp. IEGM 1372]|uniref:hypothetical protein n=1 Tax=Rhodococcus sp. IEGM 1372 TaxID=3047087 RepID=UPI0024B771B7